MKYTDIKSLSLAELKKKKDSLKGEIFTARMKNTMGQLSNPVQVRFMKRDIARIETALVANAKKD